MNSSHTNPPGCEAGLIFGERPQHPSIFTKAFLIFIILVNILTFPFTVALNALVMIAVKCKSRLRANKSNILLAMLSLTDFAVGIVVQPIFIAVIIMFLLGEPSEYCVLRVLRPAIGCLTHTSLYHLAFISGERYLAMKHPFAHSTHVTEARVVVASALAWLLSVILHIPILFDLYTVVISANITLIGLSIAVIAFCHVSVYLETRRYQQQIVPHQVTQVAREQFEKHKMIFKLTSIIIGMLFLCFIPFLVCITVTLRYQSEITIETAHLIFSFAFSMLLLNSLVNPIVYSVRMRQFRVALIELVYRTVNIAEAKEIDMRLFGAPNAVVRINAEVQDQQNVQQANLNIVEAKEIKMRSFGAPNVVVRLEAGQELERQDQQNVEQANVSNNDSHNDDVLPGAQHQNYVVEQLDNNSRSYCVYYRHSI